MLGVQSSWNDDGNKLTTHIPSPFFDALPANPDRESLCDQSSVSLDCLYHHPERADPLKQSSLRVFHSRQLEPFKHNQVGANGKGLGPRSIQQNDVRFRQCESLDTIGTH